MRQKVQEELKQEFVEKLYDEFTGYRVRSDCRSI